MENFKCAFAAPLITKQFGCHHALEVTRRGGPDIACQSEPAHQRCGQLFDELKAAALPAMGHVDDLNLTPASVYTKLQYGGLLGLRRQLDQAPAVAERIDDIDALVERLTEEYPDPATLPCQAVVPDITAFKLRRR
jgi:hypothetical protein